MFTKISDKNADKFLCIDNLHATPLSARCAELSDARKAFAFCT